MIEIKCICKYCKIKYLREKTLLTYLYIIWQKLKRDISIRNSYGVKVNKRALYKILTKVKESYNNMNSCTMKREKQNRNKY